MDDELFNSLNIQSQKFSELESLLNTFVEELSDRVAVLTRDHFYGNQSAARSRDIFKNAMQSGEYIKIYSYMMCKEIQQIIADFTDTDSPAGQQLKYTKKEFPRYDENWIEVRLQSLLKEYGLRTQQERAALRKKVEKERAEKVRYQEYEKAIHKELKRLVLKHCPHITSISGNGLRPIDYMLREYMFKITKSIRPLIDD